MSQEQEKTKPLKKPKDNTKKILKEITGYLRDKKCEDIKVLNLEKVNSYLNYFVIATANSTVQARAAAREIEKETKEYKFQIPGGRSREHSSPDSGWVLLDLGEIVIHIMTAEKRKFYDLERLWGDAKILEL